MAKSYIHYDGLLVVLLDVSMWVLGIWKIVSLIKGHS